MSRLPTAPSPDVVVIGAGIVGSACALALARAGARVSVYDRAFPGSGSSGACEGNVLAWDKELRRELPLAVRSAELWAALADELPDDFEYDRKGSLVVAETEADMAAARERAAVLAGHGVAGRVLAAAELREEEPYCAQDLAGGVLYPGDAQLEPRLATIALARAAQRAGARVCVGTAVEAIERSAAGYESDGGMPAATAGGLVMSGASPRTTAAASSDGRGPTLGRATAVRTAEGRVPTGAVVVAAGVWTPAVLAGASLGVPVRPRKGHILVMQRSPVRFRRKLSEAGYVSAVEADGDGLQVAMVVESTPSGTTLLGSSREHQGFDTSVDVRVAAAVARRAARFFPVLRELHVLRVYTGLRPRSPDHLPIIGPLAEAENVCVATGHEGAGIGLAPATAELVTAWYAGAAAPALEWFSPDRFERLAEVAS
jgi:D-hydroxyproline dehydrogenase subunit beta